MTYMTFSTTKGVGIIWVR